MQNSLPLDAWFAVNQSVNTSIKPLGNGHIHNTYLVGVDGEQYVLQNVNKIVFIDPDLVMSQTRRVLACFSQQTRYKVPVLVETSQGKVGIWRDGQYWRLWEYVPHSLVVDPIETLQQAAEAGSAFGALQKRLEKMPGEPLVDPIYGFLQLEHYLNEFEQVATAAPVGLRKVVDAHRHLSQQFSQRNCVIHGDCKVNNLLFNATGDRVLAVIDFDTAMFGHWAWDFGDLIRSVCFSRRRVEGSFFGACLKGFAQHQDRVNVRDSVAAPAYVALMLGLRFLTDHLQGNIYFRAAKPGENLLRARAQFELLEEFVVQAPQMQRVAGEVLG